jgi:YYY domain-containing protein
MLWDIVLSIGWWAGTSLLGLICFPLIYPAAKSLNDRAYGVSKPFGILLLCYLSWMLSSLGLAANTRLTALLSLLLIAAASLRVFHSQRNAILRFFRSKRRLIAAYEAAYLLAFIAFALVRVHDSSIMDTEKPSDFMLVNGAYRTQYFPFQDPWLSGHTTQNYYFGQMCVAVLAKLFGVETAVAYNLAVATFFSLTVIVSAGILYNLTSSLIWGCVGGIFLPVAGNLNSILQIISSRHVLPFDFFLSAHYIIPGTINEFPYFSFLLADLHAHLIVLPFALSFVTWVLCLFLWKGRADFAAGWAGCGLTLLMALSLGALVVNPVDMPGYGAFAAACVLARNILINGRIGRAFVYGTVREGAPFLGLSYLLYLPFHQNFGLNVLKLGWVAHRTALRHYLIIYGLFVFLLVSYALWAIRGRRLRLGGAAVGWADAGFASLLLVLLLGGLPAFLGYLVCLSLAALGVSLTSKKPSGEDVFALILFLVGVLLSGAIEAVFIDDAFTGDLDRVNTVFKVGMEIWVFFSLSAAYGLSRLTPFFLSRADFSAVFWCATCSLLIGISLLYPVLATYSRTEANYEFFGRNATFDGLQYMNRMEVCSRGVVDWANLNIHGTPVVLEAPGDSFTFSSCVSSSTGLPTVLGWDGHERQWRYRTPAIDEIEARRLDIDRIYSMTGGNASEGSEVPLAGGREARWAGDAVFSHPVSERTGKKALTISSASGSNADGEIVVPLSGGLSYTVSAWIKTDGVEKVGDVGKVAQILVRADKNDAPGDILAESPPMTGSSGWKRVEVPFYLPLGSDRVWLTFVLGNWGDVKGTVTFDAVVLAGGGSGSVEIKETSTEELAAILTKYNVSYVYVGPRERSRYSPLSLKALGGLFREVYRDERSTLYSVREFVDGGYRRIPAAAGNRSL